MQIRPNDWRVHQKLDNFLTDNCNTGTATCNNKKSKKTAFDKIRFLFSCINEFLLCSLFVFLSLQGLTICLFFVLFDARNNNPSPPPSSAREPSIQTQSEVIDLQSVTAKTINSIISESVSYHKYNLTGVYRGNWIESYQNTLVNHLEFKNSFQSISNI
jgi:hypothetical protein